MKILNNILKDAVKRYPNTPALTMKISHRIQTLTFRQVYDMARQIALFLQKQGITHNDKILIFAPNSPYWGTIFWATILNKNILVPVNIQNTSAQINKILDQTEAKLIFQSKFLKRDIDHNIKRFDIELIEELISELNPKDFKEPEIHENDLIEILYTSGTTGDPKGVMLTHKNIYSNIQAVSQLEMIQENKDRLLSILPLTHIFEQTIGFFLPFYYKVHIIYTHSYSAIADLLQQYKITKMIAVPEFLKLLMSKIKDEAEKKKKLKLFNKMLELSFKFKNKMLAKILFHSVHKKIGGKLDTIGCGGAFLDPNLEKEWNALGITLLQGYGLTETSPLLTANTYKQHKFESVGKPVGDVQIKISDESEILAKGSNVFSGYFKNEEKTKQEFTDDGWFKTGDMGEFDKDGFLFLKGRKKYIIIGPGGQNIFPEDIELELNKIEGVKDSCVLGIHLPSGMVEVHAVLLLKDQKFDIEKIINTANEDLATYQRITGYSAWPDDDFPRSATRKVKKEEVLKILQSKKDASQKIKKDTDGPVKKILSQITGVEIDKIHAHSKLIENLKIDSLMWVEIVGRIGQDLNVAIDETIINQKTTVAELEKIIEKHEPLPKLPPLKKWSRSFFASWIRNAGQFLTFLYSKFFIKLKTGGLENLKNINLPVIFMSNHISYIDSIPLLMSLPFNIRKRIAIAAARDVVYEEFKHVAWLAELFANTFPLPRKEGENIMLGLDYMGQMLDDNYSVIIFPEGHVSESGKFQELKRGAGLIAVDMNCQIIPVKITGTNDIVPYEKLHPRKKGTVVIKFGKPIKFKKSDSYEFAREKIENEMKIL
ncbi:MAG: AMP-binding protein [bacterium]